MKRLLIKQAIFLPVIYFGSLLLAGFFANDYSHSGQHASELGINSNKTAAVLFQTGIIITSLSLIFFATGLILNYKKRFCLFSFLVFMFAITFIFGAIFPIGSPWHGLYGLGLFVMIIPLAFLYELNDILKNKTFHLLSIAAGFLMFIYLWSLIAGLDPAGYRGLTQRLFGMVVFGWFSYVAFHLNSYLKRTDQ